MCLSHDIWHQIIQYFDREAVGAKTAEKKAVLLNLAVTSRLLSGLALATLWKQMDRLCPIVDVINSFTPAQDDPFLTWVDDGENRRYWKFSRKPSGDQVDVRVKEYLSRIRVLQAGGDSASERALWSILVAWFWKAEPLLPNLQELVVGFKDNFPMPYQYLTFMAPPRLRFISTQVGVRCFEHVVTFYQLLRSRGCSPTEVHYFGDLQIPPTLTLFENLNTLVVEGPYNLAKHGSPFSLLGLLQQLPSLKWLQIDLGTLQTQIIDPLGPFEHLTLETFMVEGTTEELHPFLSCAITCPLVSLFLLKIRFNTDLTWKSLLEKATIIFPNFNELVLEAFEPTGTPQLVLSDLDRILLQPMESLMIDGIPNKLSRKELQQILAAWPKLHTLTLTGGKSSLNAEALLSTHICRNLYALHLPFDFIPLASPLTHRPPATQKNPLRSLQIAAPTRFPSTLKEKIVLAQNLIILLPHLKTVRIDDGLGDEATDLQDIIKGMQAVVTAVRPG